MSMKFNFKSFVMGVVFATALMTTTVGFAASSGLEKKITVLYNNIKLVVDGKPASLGKDLSGKTIEPFIYNGTTYLPVRAIGEALDKDVDWDGKTQTVYVGQNPGEVKYMTEVLNPVGTQQIHKLADKGKFNMNGKLYNTGFHNTYSREFIYFNLDSKYTEIEGDIGTMYSKFEGDNGMVFANQDPKDLDIYLDDKLYKTIKISGETAAQKVKIPVSGVNQLKFKVEGKYIYFGLADFTIK